jgi:hypothetical protein
LYDLHTNDDTTQHTFALEGSMPTQPIASVQFADGACRLVYEDANSQYVIDDKGEPMYGVWFFRPDELRAMFEVQQMSVSGSEPGDLAREGSLKGQKAEFGHVPLWCAAGRWSVPQSKARFRQLRMRCK